MNNINKEDEINYIVFALGYDLLNDMLSKSEYSEIDISYDFCKYLANIFIESTYYENEENSIYENLRDWVEKYKDLFKNEYKEIKNFRNFDRISIKRYLEKIGIADKVIIPETIDELIDLLDVLRLNYWSYDIFENPLGDFDNIVIVYDKFGKERIFETVETKDC